MDYLDFAIEVHAHTDDHYIVAVRSPAGEARTAAPFPFTDAALESHLLKLENAILRSAGRRRKAPTPEEEAVQSFGRELFTFLLRDELLSRFRTCQQLAHEQKKGVRIKLTVTPPELAGLPWEFLYDATRSDYLCLDAHTPLVRYPALPLTIQPLTVTPPLRILGLCVDTGEQRLDVAEEKARMEAAVQELQAQGLVELAWLAGQTADDLQRALRRGPWHILHFIGHGRFDTTRDEGLLLLADAAGRAAPLYATQLARLLASQRHHLRLVLLNACEGARSGRLDLFASTAATLVGSGIPAVLAMQYEITDAAAIDFARTFYEALADNLPVDSAVVDARNAMTLRNRFSLEWGTPVLYLRAPDGRLFAVAPTAPPAEPVEAPLPPPLVSEQPSLLTFARATLAHLYPDEASVRRVVADAGLAADRIAFCGHATNTWQAILSEAEKAGQMGAVLAVALKEYGSNQALQAVAAFYGRGVASPSSATVPVPAAVAEPAEATPLVRSASPIAFDWVTIPAGKFWMGSDKTKDKDAQDREMPQHEVNLSAYRIARYPVTNVEYKRFVDAKGYQPPSHWEKGQIPRGKEKHPVVNVSWQDAMAFCEWAGVQLPSEAQWEKAARGTDGRIYPWGNETPNQERCNFDSKVGDTMPVDHYPNGKSFYGVWDMAGNVWEWTNSLYKNYPYNADDGREDSVSSGPRVLRGGSFVSVRTFVRCASRNLSGPDYRFNSSGFRILSPGS